MLMEIRASEAAERSEGSKRERKEGREGGRKKEVTSSTDTATHDSLGPEVDDVCGYFLIGQIASIKPYASYNGIPEIPDLH